MAAKVTPDPAELEPLLRLCRRGRLFEVQEWIRDGKPIALSPEVARKIPKRNPLRAAIDEGFHSLVQVLLEAGCPTTVGNYRALDHAVELRRPDLASLLIKHGADVREVSMAFVLEMWDPEMVDLFLSHGASLHRGNPVALALIYKMRPALGLLKRFPEDVAIRKQGGMALRYHASEGNEKWFALLLWAGADPWEQGPYSPEKLDFDGDDGEDDEDECANALELAAYRGVLEIFKLKKITAALASNPKAAASLISAASLPTESNLLAWLLDHGHRPDVLDDRGSLAICHLLQSMSCEIPTAYDISWSPSRRGVNSHRAMEKMKMVHMLLANGAKWSPVDKHQMASARRSLLMMAPSYVVEFVWLMQRYQACRRQDIETLLGTPAMQKLMAGERTRVAALTAALPVESTP
jgi:hypothetical protein